jgi:C-terminal processing protease CtpA/Prc
MKKLVIDIRNNGGGYDEISTALASLFSKEKKYAFSLGYRLNNKNNSLVDHYVLKDGEFSDIKVVVLTNMRCASAGDGIVLYLSRIDGITIAGLTDPEGVNQETGGVVYMPKGAVINYPVGLILDQDGNPNIDIDDSRTSRNPVDIKIPLTKENAIKIFDGEDYELEWAIDYLNK